MRKIGFILMLIGFIWLCYQQLILIVRAGIRPVLAEQYEQIDAARSHLYSASEVESIVHATAVAAYDAASPPIIFPGIFLLVGGIIAAVGRHNLPSSARRNAKAKDNNATPKPDA